MPQTLIDGAGLSIDQRKPPYGRQRPTLRRAGLTDQHCRAGQQTCPRSLVAA